MTPLAFRCERSFDENSLSITSITLELVSLVLTLLLFIFLFVLEIWMELRNPFLVNLEQHQGVTVTILVVHTLELASVDRVSTTIIPED